MFLQLLSSHQTAFLEITLNTSIHIPLAIPMKGEGWELVNTAFKQETYLSIPSSTGILLLKKRKQDSE